MYLLPGQSQGQEASQSARTILSCKNIAQAAPPSTKGCQCLQQRHVRFACSSRQRHCSSRLPSGQSDLVLPVSLNMRAELWCHLQLAAVLSGQVHEWMLRQLYHLSQESRCSGSDLRSSRTPAARWKTSPFTSSRQVDLVPAWFHRLLPSLSSDLPSLLQTGGECKEAMRAQLRASVLCQLLGVCSAH